MAIYYPKKNNRSRNIFTMMLSQSVFVAESDFLMQFPPAGSLHTKIF